MASLAFKQLTDLTDRILARDGNQLGMVLEHLPKRRQGHPARGALKQVGAQAFLQVLDAPRQRRLADRDLVGRLPNAALGNHRQEIAQQVGATQQPCWRNLRLVFGS
jgi:hypothetical protein